MNPSDPENTPAPAFPGRLSGNPAQTGGASAPESAAPAPPLPPAKPGLFGIWANPKKCDTSAWNIYYYYFRQVAQHMPSCKLKTLKWIGLAANILCFGLPLLFNRRATDTYVRSFLEINSVFFYLMMGLLTLVPVVMIGNAFKLKVKRVGFMTSRAKEPPMLLHLVDYTSCDKLMGGVVQSMIYTYSVLLLYLLPCFIAYFIIGAVHYRMLLYSFVTIPVSILIMEFLILQRFCFRLDTLIIAFMLVVELGSDLGWFFFLAFLFDDPSLVASGRSPWFLLFNLAVALAYFPLAAADTLEYGVGRNSARIRLLQIGIILFNLAFFLWRACGLGQEWSSGFSGFTILPCLWIMVGFIGLLCSSLSAASFRAKACFIRRTVWERIRTPFGRFHHPASPCSALSVCILEIVVALIFISMVWTRTPMNFYKYSTMKFGHSANTDAIFMLMAAMMIWSVFHFALALMYHFRRKSHTDKKPWLAHGGFNGLVFVFLIAFLLLYVFVGNATLNGQKTMEQVAVFLPVFYYPLSIFCLLLSATGEAAEIRAARLEAANEISTDFVEIIR